MSYTITKTDGAVLTTIIDGTVDNTSSSLTLLGRNYSNYGQYMANDLVWLLENFSNTTAPLNPMAGQLWWNNSINLLQIFNGTGWKSVSAATANSIAPATTTVGDQWWDSVNQQLYTYNGTTPYNIAGWILIGPTYSSVQGKSGPVWEVIQDTIGSNHHILSIYLDSVRTGIISKDYVFTPNVAIAGFTTIQTGHNLRIGDKLWGTASDSNSLGGVSSGTFFRNDVDNWTVGNIVVSNNNGVTVGTSQQLTTAVSGNDGVFRNNYLNGDLRFYVNVLGSTTEALHIEGSTGMVNVAADPVSGLGIATKQYVDAKFTNTVLAGDATTATQAVGDNASNIATTAFVYAANVAMASFVNSQLFTTGANISLKANAASPIFTGNPQSPTPASSDNSNAIATTNFVYTAVSDLAANTTSWLSSKANSLNSALIGMPTAPTMPSGTANTAIATTAFVYAANVAMASFVNSQLFTTGANISLKANAASPIFTGNPQSPTPASSDNSNAIATTNFVYTAVSDLAANTTSWLSSKANSLNSALIGMPTAPTMPSGTANTAIATTAFVMNNSGLFPNKIYQGNSAFTILDTGTGTANLTIDGSAVMTATISGVNLMNGATGYNQPAGTNNTTLATTAFVQTAANLWSGSAKFVANVAPIAGVNDTGSNNGDFWFQY